MSKEWSGRHVQSAAWAKNREFAIALTPRPVIAIVLKIMRRPEPVIIRPMEGKAWRGSGVHKKTPLL